MKENDIHASWIGKFFLVVAITGAQEVGVKGCGLQCSVAGARDKQVRVAGDDIRHTLGEHRM